MHKLDELCLRASCTSRVVPLQKVNAMVLSVRFAQLCSVG